MQRIDTTKAHLSVEVSCNSATRKNVSWKSAKVLDLVHQLRTEKTSWDKIAEAVSRRLGRPTTAEAVKSAYKRLWKGDACSSEHKTGNLEVQGASQLTIGPHEGQYPENFETHSIPLGQPCLSEKAKKLYEVPKLCLLGYTELQIAEYHKASTSRYDMWILNDQQVTLLMLGNLYPNFVKANRAIGRKVEIADDSPVPQPSPQFRFKSREIKAYRYHCLSCKGESIRDLLDEEVNTMMLGELFTIVISPYRQTDSERCSCTANTYNVENIATPEKAPVSPSKQPHEEGFDNIFIRIGNTIYTWWGEEPLKNRYLSGPPKKMVVDGASVIEYEMLEVVDKKRVLMCNGVKYYKVTQVPRVVVGNKRRKIRLHDSEFEPSPKFVRMDGFVELGDKWYKPTQIIERVETDEEEDNDD